MWLYIRCFCKLFRGAMVMEKATSSNTRGQAIIPFQTAFYRHCSNNVLMKDNLKLDLIYIFYWLILNENWTCQTVEFVLCPFCNMTYKRSQVLHFFFFLVKCFNNHWMDWHDIWFKYLWSPEDDSWWSPHFSSIGITRYIFYLAFSCVHLFIFILEVQPQSSASL